MALIYTTLQWCTLVQGKANTMVQGRRVHWCTEQHWVGEMDEDNLRMRGEVSTPLRALSYPAHCHVENCELKVKHLEFYRRGVLKLFGHPLSSYANQVFTPLRALSYPPVSCGKNTKLNLTTYNFTPGNLRRLCE